MYAYNKTKDTYIVKNLKVADNFWSRFKGLLGKNKLILGDGLLINPCNSIHMFFMKFSIDVVFLDDKNRVIYMVKEIKPWSYTKIVKNGKSVLEIPCGTINTSNIEINDYIEFGKKREEL